MKPFRQYIGRRLSPLETVAVLLAVSLFGGLVYYVYVFTTATIQQVRIARAMPAVCDAIRQQRGAILSGLEAYKSKFGDYPPDHLISQNPLRVDPVTNTLLYELTGTLYFPAGNRFQVAGLEPAEEAYVTNFFQCQRFKNCSEKPDQVMRFLPKQQTAWRQLHDDPDVFVLGFDTSWAAIAPDLFWQIADKVSSWRYVHSTPTNNPGKFDLWIELSAKDRTITIGNWKAVE